jgi:hypothetical protein
MLVPWLKYMMEGPEGRGYQQCQDGTGKRESGSNDEDDTWLNYESVKLEMDR